LLLGDESPTGGSVYAALAGDPRVFTVATYAKTSVDKSLNDLRDKRLMTIRPEQISRLELNRKNETIEFGRNKEEWQILKPKPMRAVSFQVNELVRKVTEARMDLTGDPNPKEAESGFAHGAAIATIKATDQAGVQELQIRKNKDTYYAKSSAVEGAYKVPSDLGQAVDKGLDNFRNKKLFDFGYSDPEKIEIHNGAKAYYFSRSGADWWSNGKKKDTESVQSLLAKLRDLSASKFPDSGVFAPTIEISVASDSGKQVETISLAKSGKDYLAKRVNEAPLYEIEPGSVDDLLKAADDVKPVASK